MNLYPTSFLDLVPFELKFLLHLPPQHQGVHVDVLHPLFGLHLEEEQAEAPLNDGSLLHEETKLTVSRVRLIHAPILLDGNRGQFGTLGALKHA